MSCEEFILCLNVLVRVIKNVCFTICVQRTPRLIGHETHFARCQGQWKGMVAILLTARSAALHILQGTGRCSSQAFPASCVNQVFSLSQLYSCTYCNWSHLHSNTFLYSIPTPLCQKLKKVIMNFNSAHFTETRRSQIQGTPIPSCRKRLA